MNIAPLAGVLQASGGAQPEARPAELMAVNDLFHVQRGTTKKLWPVENDVAFIGARVSSVGPLSPNQGSITIDSPPKHRLNYVANATFTGTVACPYVITDEFGESQGMMHIFCSSAVPLPLGQSCSLQVYNGGVRWRRVLKNCSGNSLSIVGVTAPPVGSAYIVDTVVSSTVNEQAVEIYAPAGVVSSYSIFATIQDGLGRQASTRLDVSIGDKPNVTWPTGLSHFSAEERADYQTFLGRAPTAGAHFVGVGIRPCPTCPVFDQTMENIAGGPFDQLNTLDSFFLRPRAVSLYDSIRNPADRGMIRNVIWPMNCADWTNRGNARPQIWFDVSTTTGESAGLRHNDWKRGWFGFGWRWALQCGSLGIDQQSMVFDMGWEMTGNFAWRVGPENEHFIAAWRVMVDNIRLGAAAYAPGRPGFKFCFRPARSRNDGHLFADIFPGKEWVDVIAESVHDVDSDFSSEEGWGRFLFGDSGRYGFSEILEVSIATGLPMGFGEWDVLYLFRLSADVVDRHSHEGQEWLERWFRLLHSLRQRIAYETYFHEDNFLFDSNGVVRPLPYAEQYLRLWKNR